MKCYEWRWNALVTANMVEANEVDGDLLRVFLHNMYYVSILYYVVKSL